MSYHLPRENGYHTVVHVSRERKFIVLSEGITAVGLPNTKVSEWNFIVQKKNTRDNTCSVICSPSVVGECLVKAILDGENGSVWIANEGRAYKMEFPENQFLNLKESK